MKSTSEIRVPTTATGAPAVNAAGNPTGNREQAFEITREDVGLNFRNYIGFESGSRMCKMADVGRSITISFNGTGWNCWKFA